MPLSPYTTDSLLPMLRLLPLMPSVQALFSDSDLVNIMDFELSSKILPLIDNQAEEYSSGNEIRIPRLRPEDIMSNVNATGLAINPALWGFYLQNDQVILYLGSYTGSSNSYKYLRLRYVRMPSTLIQEAAAGQITNIAGNIVTVSNLPATFTTTLTYDIVANSPQMFVTRGDDLVVTAITPTVAPAGTMTFIDLPPTVQIGDWVCLAMQSPIPQIPFKPGFQLLLQLSAAKCLEIHGDTQGFNVAMSQAADMKNYFISVITPRVDANVIRLTTPNALYGWD